MERTDQELVRIEKANRISRYKRGTVDFDYKNSVCK